MSAFSPGFPGISGFNNQKFMSGWASGSIYFCEVRSVRVTKWSGFSPGFHSRVLISVEFGGSGLVFRHSILLERQEDVALPHVI